MTREVRVALHALGRLLIEARGGEGFFQFAPAVQMSGGVGQKRLKLHFVQIGLAVARDTPDSPGENLAAVS